MDLSLLLLLLLSRLRLLFLSLSFLLLPSLLRSLVAMPRQAGEERTEVMMSFAFQQTAVRLGANLTPTGRQVDEAGGPDQGGKEGGRGDEVLDR